MISIAGYTITSQIHEGSRSLVYRGRWDAENQPVILKTLNQEYPTPEEIARFKREYEITSHLKADEVIEVYALESYKSTPVMVMEDFNGVPLSQILSSRKFNLAEFLTLAIRISTIIGKIHQQHVVHKDINPSNLVWNQKSDQLKMIDFGIAARFSPHYKDIPGPNVLEGTLAYISPEQTGRMNRGSDQRTDLYSLGVTLYEILLGFLPFRTTDAMELIHCHLAKTPQAPHFLDKAIPEPVSDIVMKLLAKPADERYQSVSGLLSDLKKCQEQLHFTGQVHYVAIGQDDVADSFHIPRTVYGRHQEIEQLLTAFNQVQQGGKTLMLVSGYSGIGKTTLVHEIQAPIIEQDGYFISGSFERFKTTVPYSALFQAFQMLIQHIRAEGGAVLQAWKEKLLPVLGKHGQILIDVMPQLEAIIGKQPNAPVLSPTESRRRLKSLLHHFVQVLGTPEHPLVVFLDNVQWADTASVQFLREMLPLPATRSLMIICAYRDHEVQSDHPFRLMLEKLPGEPSDAVQKIELAPLSLVDLRHWLADTLHNNKETLIPFAKLVLEKTGGNPFAVKEFLKSIHKEGLLTFDGRRGRWQWNLEQIQGMSMTDNVVEFMTANIQKLPPEMQKMLQYAACIGNQFDLHTLAAVMKKTEAKTASDLEVIVQEGFVLPEDESYQYIKFFNAVELKEFASHVLYNFAHNRFQEAVLQLLPLTTQEQLHLTIGRHLLRSRFYAQADADGLVEIVAHLNRGAHLIETDEEKYKLIHLNLLAGKHAKSAADLASALRYLTQAMSLLSSESWQTEYSLTFDVYHERAELEHTSGNFAQAEKFLHQLIHHARTPREKAAGHPLLILQYTLTARYHDAIEAGRAALALLHVPLPEKHIEVVLEQKQAELERQLEGKTFASLLKQPMMSDPEKQIAMKILDALLPAAFQFDPILCHTVCVIMLLVSLHDGHTAESASGYAHYGVLLSSQRHACQHGYEFGEFATTLSKHFGSTAQVCKTTFVLASSLTCWVKPLQETHRFEHIVYQNAVASGELQFAGFALVHRIVHLFYEGTHLAQLLESIPECLDFSDNTYNQAAIDVITGCHLLVNNLCGHTADKTTFALNDLSEKQYLSDCRAHHSAIALGLYLIMKAQVLYLYDVPEQALQCLEEARQWLPFFSSFIVNAAYHFYQSLCLIMLYPSQDEAQQQATLERLADNQQQLQRWAGQCPENFQPLFLLVQAEHARLTDDDAFHIMQLYQQALEMAKTQEFLQYIALTHELAARFYREQGFDEFADIHLREAYRAYSAWGSTHKAAALRRRYPKLLRKMTKSLHKSGTMPATSHSTSILLNKEAGGLSILDLNTVIKASQAISGEIVLENLLKQMMKLVIENAGAQKGWLILKRDDQWVVEAEGTVDSDSVDVLRSIPVGAARTVQQVSPVPSTIIHYVIRTGEAVVLSHAVQEGKFTYDPYIVKHCVKSVLCAPLMKQGALNGIIYLENNLTTGAFAEDRLVVLKMLSAQMVVSLENALLYKKLDESLNDQIALSNKQIELINAYSRFVPREFLSLLEKKSITEVQLGDQVEKEITVMFSDIRGFTHISEQMTPQENFNFINSLLRQMGPIIHEYHGFIDKYIGDGIMALFPTNADDAVQCAIAMLKQLKEYNHGRNRAGYPPVQLGIGLNTGLLMLGTVGDQHRMDGTVISDAVNLASRIETMTKTYGVSLLISETTYFELDNPADYGIRIIDQVQAKGKAEPVTVFEVFNADPPDIVDSKLKTLVLFRQGFKLYHRTKFAEAHALFNDVVEEANSEEKHKYISEAKVLFEEILHVNPHDKVARIYLQRCEQILKYGVLDEWANVWAWVETLKKT